MKYLSLFSGVAGFELGIAKAQQRYEEEQSRVDKIQGRNSDDRNKSEQALSDGQTNDNRAEGKLSSKEISEGGSGSVISKPDIGQNTFTCVGYSEIDKYAIQVYERHFPGIKNYGDCTKIRTEDLPDFDMLCGGFPCQTFSIAGKRLGFEDTRGTLFFEIARIAKAKQPQIIFIENVKGLLSHDRGRTFATILATLDELGYNAEWECLNSKYFGVPQNRERVFIIGHLRTKPSGQIFPLGTSSGENNEVEQRNATKNEIVYAQKADKEIARIYSPDGIAPALHLKTGGWQEPKILDCYNKAVRDDCCTLTEPHHNSIRLEDTKQRIRRLTPVECERLQGFPDNWTAEGTKGKISDSQRYKMLGNAVTTNVIEAIVSKMIKTFASDGVLDNKA